MNEKVFTKIPVGKYSPKNGCFACDGDVLVIKPRRSLPQRDHVRHFFVSARDLKTKSRYGWVEEIKSFTLTEFVRDHLPNFELSTAELSHIQIMLNSMSSLPKGTPIAATYSLRGVHKKVMQLTVHKVIFYKERWL
jgi:hypothetical protein